MNIEQAVRQALSVGAIASETIGKLQNVVVTKEDARALAILADAVSSNFVVVTEVT